MFEKIKRFYYLGLWSAEQVQEAVAKNVITQEQADEIMEG